jgi:hypothetical protein
MQQEKRLRLFVVITVLALVILLFSSPTITGEVTACPRGFLSAGGYCVEQACQNKQVKCLRQGSLIKRPDCHCTGYMGKFVCGIKGGERTAVKLPTCTRRGQLNRVCGSYDSNLRKCVLNPNL